MSTLGEKIDDIWDEVVSVVTNITYSADSSHLHVFKGSREPIDEKDRTYIMLGSTNWSGFKTATNSIWLANFVILTYYNEPNHTLREQMIREIGQKIIEALEADRSLDGEVENLEAVLLTPMVYKGYERSNIQIGVSCRFTWNITANYSLAHTPIGQTDFNDIISLVGIQVAAIPGLLSVLYHDKDAPYPQPMARILLRDISQTPLTTQKTLCKLTLDIPIYTVNSNITQGEIDGLFYAGRVVEVIGDDPRLNTHIESVESMVIVPNWAGQNGYERSTCAVQLALTFIR